MPIQLPGSPQLPSAQKRGALSYRPSFAPDNYSGASIRAPMGDAGGMFGGIAAGLSDAAQALEKRKEEEDKFALAQARSHFLRASIAAESELMNEQDPEKFGEIYDKRMNRAKSESLGMVKDPRLARALDLDLGDEYLRGAHSVLKLKKQKEADIGVASLNESIARNTDTALALNDDARIGALLQDTNLAIDGAVQRGYIDHTQAQTQKRTFIETFAKRKIATVPAETRAKILAPKETRSLYQLAVQSTGGDGRDAATLQRIAYLESRNDPMAVNPLSGAAGPLQFMPETAKQYGVNNPHDWQQSISGGAKLLADNKKALTSKLNRTPAPFELYLAHQQGAGGAGALIKNPEMNAIDALKKAGVSPEKARNSIVQNGGTEDMTAADFTLMWATKFGGVEAEDIPVPVYEKTGTWVDFLPYDQRVLLHAESVEEDKKLKKEALTERRTTVTDAVQGILQQTNGQIGAVPAYIKQQAIELGVWDTATSFSGRSDEETLLNLKTMKSNEFRNIDLREYRDRLSASDYEAQVTRQAELGNPTGEKVGKMADAAVDYYQSKFDPKAIRGKNNKEALARFKELAEERFADEIRDKGAPDWKRQQEILKELMLNSVIEKPWQRDPSTLTMQVDDIPEEERTQIEDSLIARGIDPSAANVINEYRMIVQSQKQILNQRDQ